MSRKERMKSAFQELRGYKVKSMRVRACVVCAVSVCVCVCVSHRWFLMCLVVVASPR